MTGPAASGPSERPEDAESHSDAAGRRVSDAMPVIAILDYGVGNLRSVEKALSKVGAVPLRTDNHDLVRSADGVILPGVGAFPKAMKRVHEKGFDELIAERLTAAVPVFGICLGMQLLFESSAEHDGTWGLGLLQGRVEQLDAGNLKIPQIGWNTVKWTHSSPLTTGIPNPGYFYFANSYAARAVDSGDVLGTSDYGAEFIAVVEKAPLYGAQFHPEKSSSHGLRLLANFSAICVDARTERNAVNTG